MAEEMVRMAREITMKEAPEEAFSMVLKTYLEQKFGEEFSLSWEHEEGLHGLGSINN